MYWLLEHKSKNSPQAKRKQLAITLTKMYWLLGSKSKLSTSNKVIIYKPIHTPIWTYGIQFLGTASTSNIEIIECLKLKALRMIVDAPLVRAEYGYPKGSPNTNN
jgi:hypothetical protein